MDKTKKPKLVQTLKDESPVIKEAVNAIPVYKRPLLPFVFLAGVFSEAIDIGKNTAAEKRLVTAIKDKYAVDDVKPRALGCRIDAKNIFQSQTAVIAVDGADYAFLLEVDRDTMEPSLFPAPFISDSMPYQPCPVNPADLLKP